MDWGYACIMGTALWAGWLLSRRRQQSLPLSRLERLGIATGAFCGAMVGAKLPFLLTDWRGMVSGAAWFSDGKTIVLGLVGGYFGVEIAKWVLQVRTKTGDSFAVPVAVAVGIGRLACFHAGCCHGTETVMPWGCDFGDGLRRHPTQLYEAAFHLSMAGLLAWFGHRGWFRGQLVKLYIIAYLLFRLLTELIRPEPILLAGLTVYQVAALVLLPVFTLLWWHDARQFRSPNQTMGAGSQRDAAVAES